MSRIGVKDNFILRRIAGESLLIPAGEAAMTVKGLIALSESGDLLYRLLRQGCCRENLTEALLAEYAVEPETARRDVEEFLAQLRQLDMLTEEADG